MSRIGKLPVAIPQSLKVAVGDGTVTVEGKEMLSLKIPPHVSVEVKDNQILVVRNDESRVSSAMQGLARNLINNMVIGLTAGFKKELTIVGVGYRAALAGSKLTLSLGYSHPIEFEVPKNVKVTVKDANITIEGADKQAVGEVAAIIRRFRKPEPYKGKGIRYADEKITLKEGKSVG
ncbi:MAG: 50S ribosomal protein L6 [Victivallaceae bacterium]|jgi:large subunit ribosomal protein L6|nr:50S ribosomal protein L6 [Victivallaceae bacterium]NLK82883.1 50S ribosomal protein L6 [Lentisphaerota bacterium]MDD3116333.1 50S ribosomal protein L6 [Victivallaceae bacterium]MDD3703303.1 50S ribosomal protein L6 [Victivallaceae bacterium]MDD4317698.1 50S ribosomal protein L6 [Victivallaceae bacterium]